MVRQGNGYGGGGSRRLERGLDERGPDDGDRGRRRRGRSVLQEVGAVGHVPVVLHNLLNDLTLVVVEYTGAEVVLYLVLQDGVFLACKKKKNTQTTRSIVDSGTGERFERSTHNNDKNAHLKITSGIKGRKRDLRKRERGWSRMGKTKRQRAADKRNNKGYRREISTRRRKLRMTAYGGGGVCLTSSFCDSLGNIMQILYHEILQIEGELH